MAPIISLPAQSSYSIKFLLEVSYLRVQESQDLSNRKYLKLVVMEGTFVREYKPWEKICGGMLRHFFYQDTRSSVYGSC